MDLFSEGQTTAGWRRPELNHAYHQSRRNNARHLHVKTVFNQFLQNVLPKLFLRIPNAGDVCIVSASAAVRDPGRNFRVGNLQSRKEEKDRRK